MQIWYFLGGEFAKIRGRGGSETQKRRNLRLLRKASDYALSLEGAIALFRAQEEAAVWLEAVLSYMGLFYGVTSSAFSPAASASAASSPRQVGLAPGTRIFLVSSDRALAKSFSKVKQSLGEEGE